MRVMMAMVALATVLVTGAARAAATELQWHGHAAFSITTPNGKVLLIDPWLTNPRNPAARGGADPVAKLGRVDYILLTHGHRDHVGDAVAIAKQTGAALVANPELASNLVKLSGFPRAQAETGAIMGIGGEITVAEGEVRIAMTPAVHTSSVFDTNAGEHAPDRAYGGAAAGFVIMVKDGPTFYHSGDTAYFMDMATIADQYRIDVALLNIGGHFGMEAPMAAKAAHTLKAALAVPQHFGTFDGVAKDTGAFAAALRRHKVPMLEMQPGAVVKFEGRRLVR